MQVAQSSGRGGNRMRKANAKLMPIHFFAILSLALLSFASRATAQEDAGGIVTDPAATLR